MAIPTPTPPNDGDVIDFDTSIDVALTAFRDYFNRVTLGDITAASIQAEHIVRPRLGTDFDGETRLIAPMQYGALENDGVTKATWAIRQKRLTLSPSKLSAGELWRLPLGRSIRLAADALVEFDATLIYQVRGLTTGPQYPDGAGTGEVAGHLSLWTYARATASLSEKGLTQNNLYPMRPFGWFQGSARFHWRGTLAAGKHDLFIGYARNGGAIDLAQIDVSRFVGKIEAHM